MLRNRPPFMRGSVEAANSGDYKTATALMVEGANHYSKRVSDLICKTDANDLPLLMATFLSYMDEIEKDYPGIKQLASKTSQDLRQAMTMIAVVKPRNH